MADATASHSSAVSLAAAGDTDRRSTGPLCVSVPASSTRTRRWSRAVVLAEGVHRVNPNDAQNLASLAVYVAKVGDAARAQAHAREAIRLAPDDPNVWIRAAQAYAVTGDDREAISALGRALGLGYARSDAAKVLEFERLRSNPGFRRLMER